MRFITLATVAMLAMVIACGPTPPSPAPSCAAMPCTDGGIADFDHWWGKDPDLAKIDCVSHAEPATCSVGGGWPIRCTFVAIYDTPQHGAEPAQCMLKCMDTPQHVSFRFFPPSIANGDGGFEVIDEFGDDIKCTRP